MTQISDGYPAADPATRRVNRLRVLVYGVLPALVLLLAIGAGALKWQNSSRRSADIARSESVQAATDSAIAILSYTPDTVDTDVAAAQELLTEGFGDSYRQLARDTVIRNAKERDVSASVDVPATASVSATLNHAVVLVYADQMLAAGSATPTEISSSLRVTLDRIGGRWLVSGFDPV